MLAAFNVLALLYPIRLLYHADSTDENLLAAFAFMGAIFLLVVIDAVSIVVADAFGKGKRSANRTESHSEFRLQRSSAAKNKVIEIAR